MSKSQTRKSLSQTLLRATQMTGMGRLMDATRIIQNALMGSGMGMDTAERRASSPAPRRQSPAPAANDAEPAHPAPKPRAPRAPAFAGHSFLFDGEQYPYRLYIPAAPDGADLQGQAPMPLIVLLHGCKQDAQDFARGTAMNALADEHQCMVLYPEQTSKSNSQRCWNWFEPDHQQLDQGEPGMIAALTRHVLAGDYKGRHADPARVYVAGLSAGGAMAAVVAGLYPDIFAAVGVHSGLPSGAAQDLMSAFGAMRRGAKGHAAPAMPTIVFHGSADTTVHPDNGDYVSDAALAALKASGLSLVKSRSTVGAASEQRTERVVYREANGPSYVEHWRIDAGPHAWSGGDAAGSYTDPDGPSASAAMLAFFLQHKLQASTATWK
ncbi:MAG: PHB depolymerase family esterase [Pseudomonadota bacterium]